MTSPHILQPLETCRTISIIGAGVMGREIAAVALRAGLAVRLNDANVDCAEAAVQSLRESIRTGGNSSPSGDSTDADNRVRVATEQADIADADLILEAVTENIDIKSGILSGIEPHLAGGTILASNSSSLSMTELSRSLKNPGRFCGLHFCHPVSERLLVEIVTTNSTSTETRDRAHAFASGLGMFPFVVRDSPGFLLNRLLVPFLNEALELLLDGAAIETLDSAASDFGLPHGPLRLFDEFGIDVAIAVGRSLYRAFPDRIVPSELLIAMYKSKRLGRKAGGGFYRDGEVDPVVIELIQERRRTSNPLSDVVVRHRLFLPMLLEATRTLSESLADNLATVDDVLRKGLGMTCPDSGIFAWANRIGLSNMIDRLRPLQKLGQRFEPTALLLEHAANGTDFSNTRSAA
ncbi:MAG: 3-hydroxyacyl-CoA dehydrogenase family protein [Planctomycetaceae bacterium]